MGLGSRIKQERRGFRSARRFFHLFGTAFRLPQIVKAVPKIDYRRQSNPICRCTELTPSPSAPPLSFAKAQFAFTVDRRCRNADLAGNTAPDTHLGRAQYIAPLHETGGLDIHYFPFLCRGAACCALGPNAVPEKDQHSPRTEPSRKRWAGGEFTFEIRVQSFAARGTVNENSAPPRFSTQTLPPYPSTRCLTMERPRPVPPEARERALSRR